MLLTLNLNDAPATDPLPKLPLFFLQQLYLFFFSLFKKCVFCGRKFINECPSGLITLHEFQRHFCDGTVGSESAEYAQQIYRTLDNNGVSKLL